MRLFAFFMEILPLVLFFIGYEWGGLFVAASLSSGAGMLMLLHARITRGRVAFFPIFTVVLSAIFTLIAIGTGAETFIKIQPTVFNGLFSVVLLAGVMRGFAVMKYFFGAQFSLDAMTWMTLSFRWGIFFGFLAIANELAWRNLDSTGWVWVKTFIFAPLSGLFMLAQLPVTLRGRLPHSGEDREP